GECGSEAHSLKREAGQSSECRSTKRLPLANVATCMRVTIGEQVYAEAVNDEVVLLELSTGQYYGLDTVGSRLWELLTELRSTEAVVDIALAEYEVGREELTRDLEQLV